MSRFADYQNIFPNARLLRSDSGVLEVAQTAQAWGAVNEIVPADKLLPRARESAEALVKLPRLTTRYTRIALTQKLRRIVDEGIALEGISAAEVALSIAAKG